MGVFLSLVAASCPAADVTFYSYGDPHYGAADGGATHWVTRINALPGTTYPAAFGGGTVDVPRGVMALGDLIDNGGNLAEGTNQWKAWKADYGVNGEGVCNYPVFECFGNHDLHSSRFVQKDIIARNPLRPGLTSISSNGLHYSWDWDGVHFVALGMYPADKWTAENTYSSIHDPEYALAFLKWDLANNVGDSGRPVITMHHYDFFTDWWPDWQKLAYPRELDGYNVILILHGHQGAGYSYNFQGYTVSGENGSLNVLHITTNNVIQFAQSTGLNSWGNNSSKSFTMPDLGRTWNPVPRNGHRNVATNLTQLSWRKGAYVVTQDVFFGMSSGAVAAATTPDVAGLAAGVTSCAIPAAFLPLAPGTEYFWRVDQYNGAQPFAKGKVWSFRTRDIVRTNDITFLVDSDIHYEDTSLTANKRVVRAMNGIPGTAYPTNIGGFVATPRGLVFSGDAVGENKQWQYDYYKADYGLTADKVLEYPVAGENNGNHDGGLGSIVGDGIVARNRTRTGLTAISSNGLHISWNWDGVHFVTLGVRPGTNANPYNSHGALEFLAGDLATNVGNSGQAVVLSQHFGMDDYGAQWWTDAERARYYDVIKDFNIIGIFHGHTHSCTIYKWQGIDVFNAPHMDFEGSVMVPVTSSQGFFVCRIVSNRMSVAERKANGTWGTNLSKTIFLSYASAGLAAVVDNGGGATNVGAGEATLAGELVFEAPGGAPTSVTIYWGPNDGGTNRAAWSNSVPLGPRGLGRFTAPVNGLQGRRTYYYRCFVTNALGADWADSPESFQTQPAAEVDNTGGATGLSLYGATLNGSLVATNAAPTEVRVYWGPNDGGTNIAAWSNQVSLGSRGLGAFSAAITGLNAGATYFYRSYATNGPGDDWADSTASFQTWSYVTVNNNPGASGVGTGSATLNGTLIYDSGPTPQVRIYWGPADGGTNAGAWTNSVYLGSQAAGAFAGPIGGLSAATRYWYRSYATSPAGNAWAASSATFFSEPLPATGVAFSDADAAVITIAWTPNGGQGCLVVLRQGAPVSAAPTDGVTYAASAVFGSGSPLGGGFVVYAGASNRVTVTNLAKRTVYHAAVYAYAGTGAEANYQQDTPATGYDTTLGPITAPSLSVPSAAAIGATNALLGARIDSDGGSPVTSWGTVWDTTPGSSNHPAAVNGNTNGAFAHVRTGFVSATRYFARGWASNAMGVAFTADDVEFYTEPLPASGVNFSAVTNDRLTVGWASGNGAGRVAVMKQGGPVTNAPEDGVAYTASTAFRGGSDLGGGEYVIYSGAGNGVTVTGLAGATTYHVAVFEYSSATSVPLRNYQQDGPALGSTTTAFIATTYVWDGGASNTVWNNPVNWVGDTDYPRGPGDAATFNSYADDTVFRLNETITVGRIDCSAKLYVDYGVSNETMVFETPAPEAEFNWLPSSGSDPRKVDFVANMVLKSSLKYHIFYDRHDGGIFGIISGPGRLRLQTEYEGGAERWWMGAAGTASNTYAGGTVIMSPRSSSYLAGLMYVKKNGAFGTGDVTVEPRGRVLFEDRGANDDMIDNRASLYLQSSGTNYARITLSSGVAETIGGLYFDGVAQADGTWGSSSSVASNKNDSWFAGAGILTVKQVRVVSPPMIAGCQRGTPGGFDLSWGSVAGEVYHVGSLPSLMDGLVIPVATNLPASPPVNTLWIPFSPTGNAMFFRIHAQAQP